MTIYISTGGYSKISADKTSEELISYGINDIELSGGTYSEDLVENLKKLKNKANFQVHNYFPPPKIPFVLNLASQDKDISQLSINHIYNAIDCCEKLESKYFSFHIFQGFQFTFNDFTAIVCNMNVALIYMS